MLIRHGFALASVAVILGSLQAGAAVCASPQFNAAAGTTFAAGTTPVSVAVGDFNADGTADLVVVSNGSNSVSILLGTGAGAFGPVTTFAAGSAPFSVAVADLNADGNLDLAVSNATGGVSILLGTGTGTFGSATSFAAGGTPQVLAVGDFNADGALDLAVPNYLFSSVSISLGTGTGAFGSATTFAAGSNPYSVAVADLNADGTLDLAVTNVFGGGVSVLLGTGTGAFGAVTTFAAGMNPYSVAVEDFDADGSPDLVVTNGGSNDVSILLGTGTGAFGAATPFVAGATPISVVVADFNADGVSDLAVANIGSDNVSVLLGTGAGAFAATTNFAAGDGPYSVATGDFNADGTPDLAVANFSDATVSILLNTCTPLAQGAPCSGSGDCASGFCADGVCCDTACGGGLATDCQACAVANGAVINGTCGLVASSTICRPDTGTCDPAETCDGSLLTCPTDTLAAQGAQPPGCSGGLACDGEGACLLAPGEMCTLNSQCASGVCSGGACVIPTPTDTPTATSTVTPSATPTATPSTTFPATPSGTPTATLAAGCPQVPDSGCRTALKSLVFVKNDGDDGNDKLIWKWTKGQATSQAELSDPTMSSDYRLCVYDVNGFLLGAAIPSSTSKWSTLSNTGYRYDDAAGSGSGINKVTLKSNATEDKAKALVKGKGENLPDPVLGSLTLPVTAQLRNIPTGICMQGVYDSGDVIKNDTGQFKAKSQ